MKKTNKAKKILVLVCCAALLVCISVGSTIAYLTSTAEVTNTFTVGKVKITMDEANVNSDGWVIGEGEDGVGRNDEGNSYKLLPGHRYDKDPIIYVDEESELCYLYVIVKNEIANIEGDVIIEGDEGEQNLGTIAEQMKNKGWSLLEGYTDVYLYSGNDDGFASAGEEVPVFEHFQIKDEVGNDEIANYAGKTIVVTAYAVQADGFENEPVKAWEAANFGGTPATPQP